MTLRNLGFDAWFAAQRGDMPQQGCPIARVTTVDRGGYLVRTESGEIPAELAGKFRFEVQSASDLPCVGDWVTVQCHNADTLAIIHGVFPRKTILRRKCAGKSVDFQMIAANIDVAFVVQSCHFDFNLRRLDRYLAAVHDGHIEPILLLTKTDLISPAELDQMMASIKQNGIAARVLALSNLTGAGFDDFQQALVPGQTYCLLGSSGVGKTTLINRLIGRDAFGTKTVSGTGEGTHVTSRRQLIILGTGAMLIDTPGMREFGLLGATDGVDQSFEDIRVLSTNCRYADCRHTHEPGCAIRKAVDNGELNGDRYLSYLKLKKESDYYAMSYVDKRKKDKAFGRFVKSAKKQIDQE
jgi:ribosome biogenesis GTPase / thiamine phosphate phosphatase